MPAFPLNPVLDDFGRSDELLTANTNWTANPEASYPSLSILSNQVGAASAFKGNYWTAQLGADQEAFITVPVVPVYGFRLYCRLQNPGTGSENAYLLNCSSTPQAFLYKLVAGVLSWVGDGPVFAAGDSLGIRAVGTTISFYRKPSGGSWALSDQATNSDVTGAGYIGISIQDETTARLDDFGGGAIPVIRSQYLDYDYSR